MKHENIWLFVLVTNAAILVAGCGLLESEYEDGIKLDPAATAHRTPGQRTQPAGPQYVSVDVSGMVVSEGDGSPIHRAEIQQMVQVNCREKIGEPWLFFPGLPYTVCDWEVGVRWYTNVEGRYSINVGNCPIGCQISLNVVHPDYYSSHIPVNCTGQPQTVDVQMRPQ